VVVVALLLLLLLLSAAEVAVVVVVVVVAVAAVWMVLMAVVVVVVYTRLYRQARHKYFPDVFYTYTILKQDPLSRVFSSLHNATMTKVHGDHKAPEMNGTSVPRTR